MQLEHRSPLTFNCRCLRCKLKWNLIHTAFRLSVIDLLFRVILIEVLVTDPSRRH